MTDQRPMTANVRAAKPAPQLDLHGSRLFNSWLAGTEVSLAFTTYQAGKLFLIGTGDRGKLSVFERTFERCMGVGAGDRQFWMSSLYQLWRFDDYLQTGSTSDGYDAVLVPSVGYTTGDIDIHDIHLGADGNPVFVATRFNCIATLAERGSFRPLWMPPFIDRLAAEDRCHLNGLAVRNGKPAFVTCVSNSNVAEGWRDNRRKGGLLIDIESDETVVAGLSMPHSPRLYRDTLWMIQAGTGEFGRVDQKAGRFEPVCFLPGFARGLAFVGDHAVIGLSRPRGSRTFTGLPLDERIAAEGVEPQCGICVINLNSGDVEHRLTFGGLVEEIYDVQVLSDTRRPMALGFRSDEIRFAIRPETGVLNDP